jgi:IS30 family transposase
VVLAKMDSAGTRSVVDSFSAVLNRQPAALRKSMTYDQGREMHGHKILTERSGVQIYFADPHSQLSAPRMVAQIDASGNSSS